MNDTNYAENDTATAAENETTTVEAPIDPIKIELDKVKRQDSRSEAEKAAFSLKKTAERLKELGGDPASVLNITSNKTDDDDEDAPVTVGMLKKIEAEKAQKTSIQMADSIQDSDRRELVKHYLSNRIIPTGDPNEDFRTAIAMVDSLKNKQLLEEVARSNSSRSYTSAPGAPAKTGGITDAPLTPEEAGFMKAFGLSKEEVIKAREQSQEQS